MEWRECKQCNSVIAVFKISSDGQGVQEMGPPLQFGNADDAITIDVNDIHQLFPRCCIHLQQEQGRRVGEGEWGVGGVVGLI